MDQISVTIRIMLTCFLRGDRNVLVHEQRESEREREIHYKIQGNEKFHQNFLRVEVTAKEDYLDSIPVTYSNAKEKVKLIKY